MSTMRTVRDRTFLFTASSGRSVGRQIGAQEARARMGVRRLGSRHAVQGQRGTRRLLSACLVVLFAGAAAAPHRHKNDVADLLGDGRSDSGFFIDAASIAPGDSPFAESLRWIDDDPCLACFPSDFATTAAVRATSDTTLSPLHRLLSVLLRADLSPAIPLIASRSPPRS